MNTRTPEPARPPEPSRHPRGTFPYQNRPAPPPADGRASLSPDPASPAASGPRPASPPCRSSLRRRLRPPENAATLLRGARTVALALAALVLGVPETVQAQIVTLVSNSGQADAGTRQPGDYTYAQSFDTGSNSYGYNLSSIALDFAAAPTGTGTLTVTVREDSSGSPSETVLYTLNNPTHSAGLNEFSTQGNRTLNARTTYWVVASYSTTSGGPTWSRTGISNGVDAGAAAGWVIDAAYKLKLESHPVATWTVGAPDRTLQIAVKGTVKTTANTAPAADHNTVTTAEDTAYTFEADDFGFMDADAGDTLASVKIWSSQARGTLALDGVAITWYAVVTKAQIDAGDLTFTPARDAHGDPYVSFSFRVNDGTDDSASGYTMRIDVTDTPAPVCTAPSFGDRRNIWTGTVTVGTYRFGGSPLDFYGYNSSAPPSGDLDDQTFTIGSNDYTIVLARVALGGSNSGELLFEMETGQKLTTVEVAALRLHVCHTTVYNFSEATNSRLNSYGWSGSLDWSYPVVTRTVYLSLPANNAATGEPAITGTSESGQVLTAGVSGIDDDDGLPSVLDYDYQWFRVDADGTSNEEEISGETADTYTLTADDVGKRIKVKVSFTDELSGVEMRTSAAYPSSGTVTAAAGTPTGAPTITGTAQVGETLTAVTTGIMDDDGLTNVSYTYQWIRVNGTDADISGANSSTYPLVTADLGKTIKVRVTFVDDADNTEMLTSAAYPSSGTVTTEVTPPSLSSATVQGMVLTLVYDEPLDPASTPAPRVYILTVTATVGTTTTNTETNPAAVSVSGSRVTLTLDTAPAAGARVLLIYVGAVVNPVQDVAGNDALPFGVHVMRGNPPPTTITIAAGTTPVTEGASAAFTLTRSGGPPGNPELTVNVSVTETQAMVAAADKGAKTVIFQANLATAMLGVATVADSVDETDSVVTATVTANPATYTVGTSSSATVTVTDDDTRGVTVSAPTLAVNEGSSGTYTVVLDSEPTASVTVTPSSGNSDVTVSSALTFTTMNWSTAQMVTVTAAQDSDAVDDSATISHAVEGGDYGAVTAASVTVTVDDDETADTTAPQVASIVRGTPSSSPTNADSLTWRVTFSEAVSNVDTADFAVSGTTATLSVSAVSGVTGAYDVTASGGNLAGVTAPVTLSIASGHNIQDAASNALTNTTPTGANDNSYVVDNTAPTVTITGVPGTSSAAFTATFTFTEAVTGFVVGDITLGNATASSFMVTSTTVYTALITPTANGAVTVDVAADVALDAAGNGNTAATRASSTYTASSANNAAMGAPTITGTAQVGETLTAGTTGITDADGLTSPGYTYKWIRVNSTEADIASANSSTYILVAADLGKTIKVKVTFDDDASNTETLTSAAYPSSGTVRTTEPMLVSASVQGTMLTLVYDEPLDENSPPPPSAYTVTVTVGTTTTNPAVLKVSVRGRMVTLTLDPAPAAGATVTLAYDVVPGTNPVQDVAGNDAPPFFESVTRRNPPPPPPPPTNTAPEVANPPVDQEATTGDLFTYVVPADAFTDADGDMLTYTAALSDGGMLPSWLTFDPATRTFTGTPGPGDSGPVRVTVTASDGTATVSDEFALMVTVRNTPPEVAIPPVDQEATTGDLFTYVVPADAFTDADGDLLTYTAALSDGGMLPSWLTFDPATRTFTGTPGPGDSGPVRVTVTASDGTTPVSDEFALMVTVRNTPPEVAIPPVDQEATTGDLFTYVVPADAFTDADGDLLTYTAALSDGGMLPSWLTFDPATRTFTGTPGPGDSGTVRVTVTASDGTTPVSDEFALMVTVGNTAPEVANPLADQEVTVDVPFTYVVPADAFTDADGDLLTYTAALSDGGMLPSWLTFDPATRTFTGTPGPGDSGPVRVTVTASDGTATVSDEFALRVHMVAPSTLQAWTSRFGRTVATHVTDAVGERLRPSPEQDSHVTVGGYRLPLGKPATGRAGRKTTAEPETDTKPETATDRLASLLTGIVGQALGLGLAQSEPGDDGTDPRAEQPEPDPRLGQSQTLHLPTVSLRDVLLGSSFRLTLGDDDAAPGHLRLTAWGRVAGTQFNGRDGAVTLDGNVLTGTVGVDSEWDRLLAGLAVSHSLGGGSFSLTGAGGGDNLDNSTLTSIHPYLRYAVNERVDVWSVLGYGWGDMTLEPGTGGALETDTTLMMGTFGGRGILLAAGEGGGYQLATRADAMLTRTTSGAVAGLAETEADAHRLRLVLEGTRPVLWPEGQSVTPTVELGVRHDWGDAETGFGLELGGRVRYADPNLGLTIEAAVRGLLTHEDSDYKEWGASGTIRIAPDPNGQGLSLTLAPTWGAASSGIESLWSRQTTAGLAPQGTRPRPTTSLNAEMGYGVAAPFGTGLLTPYAGALLSDGTAHSYRLGTRWTSASGLTLNVEGIRQDQAGQQPPTQGLQFQVTWGF